MCSSADCREISFQRAFKNRQAPSHFMKRQSSAAIVDKVVRLVLVDSYSMSDPLESPPPAGGCPRRGLILGSARKITWPLCEDVLGMVLGMVLREDHWDVF